MPFKKFICLYLINALLFQNIQVVYSADKRTDTSDLLRSLYRSYNNALELERGQPLFPAQIDTWVKEFESRPGDHEEEYAFLKELHRFIESSPRSSTRQTSEDTQPLIGFAIESPSTEAVHKGEEPLSQSVQKFRHQMKNMKRQIKKKQEDAALKKGIFTSAVLIISGLLTGVLGVGAYISKDQRDREANHCKILFPPYAYQCPIGELTNDPTSCKLPSYCTHLAENQAGPEVYDSCFRSQLVRSYVCEADGITFSSGGIPDVIYAKNACGSVARCGDGSLSGLSNSMCKDHSGFKEYVPLKPRIVSMASRDPVKTRYEERFNACSKNVQSFEDRFKPIAYSSVGAAAALLAVVGGTYYANTRYVKSRQLARDKVDVEALFKQLENETGIHELAKMLSNRKLFKPEWILSLPLHGVTLGPSIPQPYHELFGTLLNALAEEVIQSLPGAGTHSEYQTKKVGGIRLLSRVPSSVLRDVGHYGFHNSHLSNYRGTWYNALRIEKEFRGFLNLPSAPQSGSAGLEPFLPKYGFINFRKSDGLPSIANNTESYGNMILVWNDSVFPRTTYSLGNSFYGGSTYPLSDLTSLESLKSNSDSLGYVEFQIWGNLTLYDAKEIWLENTVSEAEMKDLEEIAEFYDLPIFKIIRDRRLEAMACNDQCHRISKEILFSPGQKKSVKGKFIPQPIDPLDATARESKLLAHLPVERHHFFEEDKDLQGEITQIREAALKFYESLGKAGSYGGLPKKSLNNLIQYYYGLENLSAIERFQTNPSHQADAKYDFHEILKGLNVSPKISSFNTTSPEEMTANRLLYLKSHPVSYKKLKEYFDQTFPEGKPLDPLNPNFLHPSALRDFEGKPGPDGLPPSLSIKEASDGIQTIISFAETDDPNVQYLTSLRYLLTKILVYLEGHPERIHDALIVSASAGRHCRMEGAHALELVRKMFLAGEAEDGSKTPGTLEEHIAYALDGLREKIFREIVAFEGPDVEPAHVETYYRNKLSRQLGVSQGISDPSKFADSKRHRIIPITDFVHRFFNGFKGDPSSSPENRRSNRGYTPESILAEVIDYIDQNPQVFGNEDLLNFFKKGLKPSQVRNWADKHRDVVLGYLLLNDGTKEEKNEAFSSLSDDVLESAYVNHLYLRTWGKKSTRRIPTQLGMRELLTRTGHLISQKR